MDIQSKEAQIADDILKWMYKHGDIRYVSIKIECERKKAGVTEVLNEMKPYTDYIEGINSYRLNAEGCKYVKSLRNTNIKNDKQKGYANKNTGDMEKGRVFIAHWIDDPFKSEVARLIEKLGFKAVLQEELPGEGKTIITQIIDELDKSCYGVVIYTYSDVGRRKDESDGKLRPRARQNVVLEHGMLISKLGLNKVCCLVTEGIEHPSDTNGILYVDLEKKDWGFNLAKNMKAAGLSVDMNLI